MYEAFKFNFRQDLELRMTFYQHLVPLDIRIRPMKRVRLTMIATIGDCIGFLTIAFGLLALPLISITP